LRATAGVYLGYMVCALLAALALSAVVAASPVLFEVIRWAGIAYLVYLAGKLLRAAFTAGAIAVRAGDASDAVKKGFLTALLNSKGVLVYVAVLPQFMVPGGDAALQAVKLSAAFIGLCALVYAGAGIAIGIASAAGCLSDRNRRLLDGSAGGMILVAAGFMAGT
jgi:threonine/homoserine/homoserine lactone efflux protein